MNPIRLIVYMISWVYRSLYRIYLDSLDEYIPVRSEWKRK